MATGVVVMLDQGSTYATPAALVGWFLMVRGAVDVAVATMNRGSDRTWGLMLSLGVAQATLGFYAAGPLARAADPVIVTLGALRTLWNMAGLAKPGLPAAVTFIGVATVVCTAVGVAAYAGVEAPVTRAAKRLRPGARRAPAQR